MNRTDLQQLSLIRLEEAQLLVRAESYSGAFYLAGYAVECGLKACIAKGTQQYDFPARSRWSKAFTHDLAALLKAASLEEVLDLSKKQNPKLSGNWDFVTQRWSEEARYAVWSREDAEAILEAIDQAESGVLRWITKHW